jgi:hypothetical protein
MPQVLDNELSLAEPENLCSIHQVAAEDKTIGFLMTFHISNCLVEKLTGVLVLILGMRPSILWHFSCGFFGTNMVDFWFSTFNSSYTLTCNVPNST